MRYNLKFTYFKASGKYYSDGEYEFDANNGYEASKAVRGILKNREWPGLSGQEPTLHVHVVGTDADDFVPMLLPASDT